jgi:glycosyltransferase involved in cell wall biosynthesis
LPDVLESTLDAGRMARDGRSQEWCARSSSAVQASGANRRVLVIASRFPPVASVGAVRIRKFVRYLGEFGWNPVVMTGPVMNGSSGVDEASGAVDVESLRDIPFVVPVHRISDRGDQWPAHLSGWIDDLCDTIGLEHLQAGERFRWRFERVHRALAFPDAGSWRIASLVKQALRLHRRHRFDAIFSSGMPFSDHLAALAIQAILRKPWIADFRDPWVEYIHWKQWRSAWGGRLTRWAESIVVQRAARVIAVNEQMTSRFAERYDELPGDRFVTIENGYDPADFEGADYQPNGERFRLLHAGSLYDTRRPDTLIEAFQCFIAQTPGSAKRVQLDFAGRVGSHQERISSASRELPVRHVGFLPHATALHAMARADVNVILLPNIAGSEGDTTAKLYECLGSGRPILAIVPPNGAAARVLNGHDDVFVCHPDDREGIADAIRSLYTRWLDGRLSNQRSAKVLSTVTRRWQTQRLAYCLDDAVLARKRGVRVESCT